MYLNILKSNLPLQFLLLIIITALFGHHLPKSMISFFYSISLTLKDILCFLLPAITFCCLFSCFSILRGSRALKLMIVLFIIVFISNYFSTMLAFIVGSFKLIGLRNGNLEGFNTTIELLPLWSFKLTPLISNDTSLMLGFGLGYLSSLFPSSFSNELNIQAKRLVNIFLAQIFVPLLPLFALGFILKIQYEGTFFAIMQSYLSLMGVIMMTYVVYLLFLFAVAANFNFKCWIYYIKNVIPVALTAFSTMSSLVTMPVTITAAEKNTKNKNIIRLVIPATVNIHTIGLAIGIPLMALAILLDFGHEFPSFSKYTTFALYFVITQLAIAAVPGSGILIMIPLLESHLGFTSEMSALITTLYILFDPLETVANTLGNSVLAIGVSKLTGLSNSQALPADS